MNSHNETALKAVLDTMVDGVITIDKQGLIRSYNPACEKIFGYSFPEVEGKNVNMLMPPNYKRHHDDYLSNYQKTGHAKIIGIGRQVSGKRKNGDVFPMYLSVGESVASKEEAYVGIIRDLTEEMQTSEKYNALQQEYFHLSRVAAVNQMGTAIAHELNQPLAAIMNYMQAAKTSIQKSDGIDKDTLQHIMSKSSEQVERAAITLSRLRRFIKTGEAEKSNFDLFDVIKTSIDLTLLSFKKLDITVIYKLPLDTPPVFGNDLQIQQVLVNLIRNACEAMEESPKKILTLTVEHLDDSFVQVGVIDTGEGLSDSKITTLFEPFSSDKKDGLGVGLSISQSIISSHDGKLWSEQNAEHGTGFYFTLPSQSCA